MAPRRAGRSVLRECDATGEALHRRAAADSAHFGTGAFSRSGRAKPSKTPLLQGTLDLLILKALALAELHGLGVSRRIEQTTRGTFQVKPGSLFPALHRMEEAGWLASSWGASENNRRAKYYRLTTTGRRQLAAETEEWTRVVSAMLAALEST